MRANVKSLVPLQELDLRIHQLRVQIQQSPNVLREFEIRLETARTNASQLTDEVKKCRLKEHEHQVQIKALEEKVTVFQEQISKVRKNDEYQTLLKEKSGLEADKRKLEDLLLEIWSGLEVQETRRKENEKEVKAFEQEYVARKVQVEAEVARLKKELDALTQKRSASMQGVEQDLLKMYERILKGKTDGRGLARLQHSAGNKSSDDDYSCSGCHVSLTLQDVNSVLMAREPLFCRNCARLLYAEDDLGGTGA
jgi:predicted  nucleic acid-binding Zn-ribbon protein